ncbi:hypothetical protein [Streptomyces microflavus]|uniref:hypothetical protein n=1 Tax=Streptomyces microflavus TaxID=1919 RepID=UPI0033ED7A0C
MNPARRSYEARVLLVPLGSGAAEVADGFVVRGLGGMMTARGVTAATAADGSAIALRSVPLGGSGRRSVARGLDAARLVDDADMVVLLAVEPSEVSTALCRRLAEAARAGGAPITALVVGSGGWDAPRAGASMAALREAADVLVAVREAPLAASFLDVLRGGSREPVPAT